jgi:hypothetical protein
MPETESSYDFFEQDGAIFRRRRGYDSRCVHDVFRPKSRTWEPYAGDGLAPAVFGDPCEDPLSAGRGD